MAVCYDDARELLQLEFCSGAVYHYSHVSSRVSQSLRTKTRIDRNSLLHLIILQFFRKPSRKALSGIHGGVSV